MKLISIEEEQYNISEKIFNRLNKYENAGNYDKFNRLLIEIQEGHTPKGKITNFYFK